MAVSWTEAAVLVPAMIMSRTRVVVPILIMVKLSMEDVHSISLLADWWGKVMALLLKMVVSGMKMTCLTH